mmetsp:Transcript_63166/g.142451  ORF Transcript_63166/g.142451 Transcript_63166/m.142451 type:complete len:269 (-) Transcript_63166:178-984(-)
MCVSRPTVMWTESSSAPLFFESSWSPPWGAVFTVSVVWGQPAGMYRQSPGRSTHSTRRPSGPWERSSPSRLRPSAPFPRARGSASGLSWGGGGLNTRQCFAPFVWRTKTSCLSVCGGAEVAVPLAVRYRLIPAGILNAACAARHTAPSSGKLAPAELKTTVPFFMAASTSTCRILASSKLAPRGTDTGAMRQPLLAVGSESPRPASRKSESTARATSSRVKVSAIDDDLACRAPLSPPHMSLARRRTGFLPKHSWAKTGSEASRPKSW